MSTMPFQLNRNVFDAMDDVERVARLCKGNAVGLPAEDIIWLADRVLNVVQTIKDTTVTYGIIGDGGESVTPMMVERDAIVGALDAR